MNFQKQIFDRIGKVIEIVGKFSFDVGIEEVEEGEGEREGVEGLVEVVAFDGEVREIWGEVVERMIELEAEGEVGEGGGEVINGMIEIISEGEVTEFRRELVHRIVEAKAEGEVGERGGEVTYVLIELSSKGEVSERGR